MARVHACVSIVGPVSMLLGVASSFACAPTLTGDPQQSEGADAGGSDDHGDGGTSPSDPVGSDDDETDGEDKTDGTEGDPCLPGRGECQDGLKCAPYISEPGHCCVDAAMCTPITGDGQPGDECWAELVGDDCAKDVICRPADGPGSGPGRCSRMCDSSDPDSCGDNEWVTCIPFNGGYLPLCEKSCHPLRPESCEEGEGCFWGDRPSCAGPPIPNPAKAMTATIATPCKAAIRASSAWGQLSSTAANPSTAARHFVTCSPTTDPVSSRKRVFPCSTRMTPRTMSCGSTSVTADCPIES